MIYNIACGIDNNYVQHASVMLLSLSKTNTDNTFNVYVLSLGVEQESKDKMFSLFENTNINLRFIDIEKSLLANFPIKRTDYISLATYLRLFLPQVLPDDVESILYLDSDIIINGDISPLLNTDLKDYYGAACLDADQNNCTRLQYGKELGYFNAGVFLLNISKIRTINFMQQVKDVISDFPDLNFHDQDVLNYIFKGSILKINHKWNMMDCYYIIPETRKLYDDIEEDLKDVRIIHYSNIFKPWNYGCKHPLKRLYYEYLKMIPWGNKWLHRFAPIKKLHWWIKIVILCGGTFDKVEKINTMKYRLHKLCKR